MSISSLILDYLKTQDPNRWVIKGEIADNVKKIKFCYDENIGRKCRQLAEKGLIESQIVKGLVYYRSNGVSESLPEPIREVVDDSYLEKLYALDLK